VLAEDGQPVAFEDFEILLAGGPVTTSTTTTTEAPPATGTPPDTDPSGTQP
jgi:hypothetical protein